MSGSRSSSANSNTSVNIEENNHYPLWRYVTVTERVEKRGGGNVRWQCNYCNKIYFGSYSRVVAHLLKITGHGVAACNTVTPQHKFEMEKLNNEANNSKNLRSTNVPLPPSIGTSGTTLPMGSVFESKKRKGGGSALEQAFNNEAREQLSCEIARMFYSSGLPFHLARNPHYIISYSFAANTPIAGYKPPGYNALRTTHLQKERANIERLLLPIKQTWNEKGLSIVSDGWGDPQRRPLINIMAVTESGNMFLRAVNCEGEYKDKFHIAGLLKDAISEVGPYNVVQVITDNAPVCKAAEISAGEAIMQGISGEF